MISETVATDSQALAPAISALASPSLYKRTGPNNLSEEENRVALARADLIRAYMKGKDKAKSAKQSVVKAGMVFIQGYNTGHLLPKVFEVLGKTSFQTVQTWIKKWLDSDCDYTALATQYGNRKGQRKVTEDEFNSALSFALHPNRLRITEITRLTKMSLQRRGIPTPSHEATIRRALEDWRDTYYDKWVFCREGEKALNDKVLPYIERDRGLLDVGDVLVADGHTLNFQILHPFTGRPVRMTMVTWYDWASCMPVGWEVMPTENMQCVAAGLRRAIITLGKMPKVAYLDNGKAFKAKLFTDKDIDFEEAGFYGMFARLGMETIFAWPYNAQSKPVERFFGTFSEMERLMPTFSGTSIQDKPAHLLRNERLHKQMHEKKYGGWVPTVEEANQIIAGWVNEYSKRPHAGLKGLLPKDILEAGRGPGVDERALRHLMMSMDIKQSYRNGIKFMGRNYYDVALYGCKRPVLIKYDLEDLSEIYVYDETGKKELCAARPVMPVHPVARLTGNKDDLQAVKAGIEQKRRLKKDTVREAREYIRQSPSLVALPGPQITQIDADVDALIPSPSPRGIGKKTRDLDFVLPQAEAEWIEAEAAKMKVLEFKPRRTWVTDADHYEDCLEKECKGEVLPIEDMEFMRAFEQMQEYRDLKGRFEFLREYWLTGSGAESL